VRIEVMSHAAVCNLPYVGVVVLAWLGPAAIVCAVVGLHAARVALQGSRADPFAALGGLAVNGGFIGWLIYWLIKSLRMA
jgi:hypothetical protein